MSRRKYGIGYKFIRFGFMALIMILVLSAAMNYLPNMTYACEVHDNGFGLQIDQEKIKGRDHQGKLFDIKNLGPGEEYTEALTLKNTGADSFQSLITAINTSSKGKILFDSLDFTIREGSANGAVIFKGKLKDLKDISLCFLNTKRNKTYFMTLGLPDKSGNEYQRLSTCFKFVITAAAEPAANNGKDIDNRQSKNKKH